MIEKISYYYHTLRYLKPSQVLWRFLRKIHLPKILHEFKYRKQRIKTGYWCESLLREKLFFEGNNICFLNESVPFNESIFDKSESRSKLWRYNLHYFECLLSNSSDQREKGKKIFSKWVVQYPAFAKDAWEPYPTSLRIVNLIKYQLNGGSLTDIENNSLYIQARYLSKVPEYHLRGNHLFENGKALIFAGLFFQGEESEQWFSQGIKILDQEIDEQILDDGGHFELSPMYHVIILEGMLDLYNLFQSYCKPFPLLWAEKIQLMRYWLKVMTHPDGEISFFNDAALGVAVSPIQIEAYAKKLDFHDVDDPQDGITHLKESGYIRLQKDGAVALLDCAKIGPDYLPGHAHADTLSFEFSLFGQRVVVNSGTSTYSDPILRSEQRATAAHSTVEINGKNSSEVWGQFRVARRVYPSNLKIIQHDEVLSVACSYMTYGFSKRLCHARIWTLGENFLKVEDNINKACLAVSRFHLHPKINKVDNNSIEFDQTKIDFFVNNSVEFLSNKFYPEFNQSENSFLIKQKFEKNNCTVFKWSLKQ